MSEPSPPFPQKLEVTYGTKKYELPRDATLVIANLGKFGGYADYAAAYCDGLLLYHSREQKQLYLLLPDGQTRTFRGADIKQFLSGYAACLQVQAETNPPKE